MGTVNRTVETSYDKSQALRLIEGRATPFTLSVTDGKHRSTAQNKLQMLWMNEISQQLGDQTPEEVRGYCKLTIGVPILRSENEAFAEQYDAVVKPLPYPQKLRLMMAPFDFGVTRLMTTKQKTEYLDGIVRHFGEQGIVLTMPDDMKPSTTDSPAATSPDASGTDDTTPPVSSEPADETVPSSAGADHPSKFQYEGKDLMHLAEYAEKGARECRRSDEPAAVQFLAAMYPQYVKLLVSADAVTALNSIKRGLELAASRERDIDRMETWIATEFLMEDKVDG